MELTVSVPESFHPSVPMSPHFIPCDAHEGCVWVPTEQRLYFSTTKKMTPPQVGIHYLDFSPFELGRDGHWADRLSRKDAEALTATEWLHDANMANGLFLHHDGASLLLAEQGDQERPSQVTRITLGGQDRTVLFDSYRGKPLNSINKVKQSKDGHLLISDPDYGFRQGFRPPPALEPSLYIIPKGGEAYRFDCNLQMPHGIALSPDERMLYLTDTSDDGAHDNLELNRRKSVYLYDFDPATGKAINNARYAFAVDKGVPDGTVTNHDSLLVGGGDGVYVADLDGTYRGKIKLDRTAVNLHAVFDHLFVTADEGVYIIFDWRTHVR